MGIQIDKLVYKFVEGVLELSPLLNIIHEVAVTCHDLVNKSVVRCNIQYV